VNQKEKAEVERKLAESTGRQEGLAQTLREEKHHSEYKLAQARERFEEQKQMLETRFADLTDKWESKLEESERWRTKLEKESDQLRSLLSQIKTGGALDTKKANSIAKSVNEEISLLDTTLRKDISTLSENLKTLMSQMKKMNEDKNESTHKIEKEKELQSLEKKFQKQLVEAKSANESILDEMKASYEDQINHLKEESRKLEKSKENSLINLLEKEGHIKVLQEKIISYEKEKKTQIDHAEQMMKMSDMLVKVLKKIEK